MGRKYQYADEELFQMIRDKPERRSASFADSVDALRA
jgi:hypothetical protein